MKALLALLIVGSVASAQFVVHAHVPYLKVNRNGDAVHTTIYGAPQPLGAVYFEWTKNQPWTTDIFRFFFASKTPLTCRTTYQRASYFDPRVRMQLSLTGGRNAMFDPALPNPSPDHFNEEVVFAAGVRYRILFVWANRDGMVYLACWINGRQVAYRRIPASTIGTWVSHGYYIGARDDEPVEPSFPARHHIDGTIEHFWFIGAK